MNFWKILPFQGKDTSGDYTLIAFTLRYIGSVTVEPSAEGMFQVDYYTDQKVLRESSRDIITVETIKKQFVNMGFGDADAAAQSEAVMEVAILHLLGGTTKEERYTTLSQIIGSFGMQLLPIQEQDGILIEPASHSAPNVTPMQEI